MSFRSGVAMLATCFAVAATAQTSPTFPLGDAGPTSLSRPGQIAYTGHHALFDITGRVLDPTEAELAAWVEDNLARAEAALDAGQAEAYRAFAALVSRYELPRAIQGSLRLEWLEKTARRPNQAKMVQLNLAIREHWYRRTMPTEMRDTQIDRRTSLPFEASEGLAEALKIQSATRMGEIDDMSLDEYTRHCTNNGVPEPPDWLVRSGDARGMWKYEGFLNQDSTANGGNDMDRVTNFLQLGVPTEVWSHISTAPRGTCIALPRFSSPTRIRANGIICLGLDTGNACFYDRAGLEVDRDYPLEEFEWGPVLTDGVCTDCHAGENPFIVHPGEPLEMGGAIRSPVWHRPFVRSTWPQNPGPLTLLDQLDLPPGEAPCSGCHNAGFAGRFPDVLALNAAMGGLSGYCGAVVTGALDGFFDASIGQSHGPTMAMTFDSNGNPIEDETFATHRAALKALCQQSPTPPGTVPSPDDDREVVSPPLIGPLYACVDVVEVRGAIYGAEVVVTVNGSDEGLATATSSESLQFKVPTLSEGDQVVASQTIGGVTAVSDVVTVISHLEEYPSGLPAPEIDPTLVHQCGRVIAVRHAHGATVSVTVNGGSPQEWALGGDWTNVRPGKSPFDFGDAFRAQQQICDDRSEPSREVNAVAEPSPLPVPALAPSPALEGQPYIGVENLPNGAQTEVTEASTGGSTSFSTAVSWNPEIDVATPLGRLIEPGDTFVIKAELCEAVEIETDPVRPCEVLPAPVIGQPLVGDISITVLQAQPGARVLVFDGGGAKIGDGSGSEVGLTRALVKGDVLRVAQRLGRCESREAYQIAAVCVTQECIDQD